MSNELYSAAKAAEFLGVHRHTIRNWIKAGVLRPFSDQPYLLVFERAELERRKAAMQHETRRGRKPQGETKL